MKKYLFIVLASFGLNAQNTINAQNDYKIKNVNSNSCLADSSGLYLLRFNNVNMNYEFYKSLRYFYTYDANNNVTNTLLLSVLGNDTTWVNLNNFINTFDANNNLLDSLFQNWDSNTNQWKNNTRQALSYDSNSNLISTTEQDIYLGNWRNYSRTLNTYDISSKQKTSKFQYWDNINNFWWSSDSVFYNYDLSQKLVASSYYKSAYGTNAVWNYSGKDTLIYNVISNPTYFFKENWNSSNNTWTNSQNISWTYDASDRLVSKVTQDWNFNQWQNKLSDFYSYDLNNTVIHDSSYYVGGVLKYYNTCAVTGIDEKIKANNCITIYPNPTNSIISINSNLEYNSIKIINSMGQTVITKENKLEQISVSDLSNGIYFIQLIDNNGTLLKTEKFIKE